MTMTREMMEKFKALFETERSALLYSDKILNPQFETNTDDLSDEGDVTSAELETSMRMRLRNREALYAKKIDQALQRIQDGTFGECGDCGDAIEARRLEARPTATLCLHCKEEAERLEVSHIDGLRPKSLGRQIRFA